MKRHGARHGSPDKRVTASFAITPRLEAASPTKLKATMTEATGIRPSEASASPRRSRARALPRAAKPRHGSPRGASRSTARVIASPALNVTAKDRITVDGEPLPQRERTRLFLYHKPRGLVTTHADPDGRPTIFGPAAGAAAADQRRPARHQHRGAAAAHQRRRARARARTAGDRLAAALPRARARPVTQDALDRLRDGVTVDGMRYGAIEATLDREQGANVWLTFAMREGKNREVQERARPLGLEGQPPDPRVVRAVPARRSRGGRDRGGEDADLARATRRARDGPRRGGFRRPAHRAFGAAVVPAKAGTHRGLRNMGPHGSPRRGRRQVLRAWTTASQSASAAAAIPSASANPSSRAGRSGAAGARAASGASVAVQKSASFSRRVRNADF